MIRHLTISDELAGGECPDCKTQTLLVTTGLWDVDEDSDPDWNYPDGLNLTEVSGHYCPQCESLKSLSINVI